MLSEKSVSIKEADLYGNLKMIGANLPVDLVDSLCAQISVIEIGNTKASPQEYAK